MATADHRDLVPRGKLRCHPAVAAWRGLAQDPPDPEHIEVLRQGKKSATYRLVGAGPGGASIIAQRSCMAKARIERIAYERILPRLPVKSPRYYGSRVEDSEFVWLFLERSEERRGGEEGRFRWAPDHLKKKKEKTERRPSTTSTPRDKTPGAGETTYLKQWSNQCSTRRARSTAEDRRQSRRRSTVCRTHSR